MKKENRILWADDEIDLLKSHVLFLESKGYEVICVNNGQDAVEKCKEEHFDIIFLDENMPGLSGLEALSKIKEIDNTVPVVMITKSEEENIMNQAIGNKIADYLIKPVNPNQILLSIKKNINKHQIISETTTDSYRSEFGRIGMQINDSLTYQDWVEVYKKLVYWELELENAGNQMDEVLKMQKEEANSTFVKFVKKNYMNWFQEGSDRPPIMSPDIFKKKVFPLLDNGEKVFFIVLDNFRYDQWRIIKEALRGDFIFEEEDLYCSILPTATQYARNAIFAGLMPLQIQEMFPNLWVNEDEEGKNSHEEELIRTQLERFRKKYEFSYHKILDTAHGEKLIENMPRYIDNPLNVIIFNFVDMLSHARTDSKMIRELASSEAAYRSLTLSWFKHSSIVDFFKMLAQKDVKVVITTDHGAIQVNNAIRVVGDRNTNTNLRYKVGKNLDFNPKEVFSVKQPDKIGLPSPNISSTYIFAGNDDFFAYPNNYNHYVSYYKETFQHGGISLEEMLVPIVTLKPKR